jgi:hypothetical protein
LCFFRESNIEAREERKNKPSDPSDGDDEVHDTVFSLSSLKREEKGKKRQSRDATNPKAKPKPDTSLLFFNEKESLPRTGHKGKS